MFVCCLSMIVPSSDSPVICAVPCVCAPRLMKDFGKIFRARLRQCNPNNPLCPLAPKPSQMGTLNLAQPGTGPWNHRFQ